MANIVDTLLFHTAAFLGRPEVTPLDYSDDEQLARAEASIRRFLKTTPLWPVHGKSVNLAGFGTAPVVARSAEDEYVPLSILGDALGMPTHRSYAWLETQYGHAIRDQRECDEERGDGMLGWECLRDLVDFQLSCIEDDPQATPDAGGARYSYTGEGLVSTDRLIVFLMDSPWKREFFGNAEDLMRHAFRDSFGTTGLGEFLKPELDKDEAIRRARRGPVLDGGL